MIGKKHRYISLKNKDHLPVFGVGPIIVNPILILTFAGIYKEKVFDCITENKLVTTGVYAIVRHPIYSAFLLVCVGAIL